MTRISVVSLVRRSLLALAIGAAAVLVLAPAASATTAGGKRAPFAYLPASRMALPSGAYTEAALARKIPSFSRQTRLACNVCHYAFPQLTPFGRMFKLNGYTLTGLQNISARDSARQELSLIPIPPASAMVLVSMMRTGKSIPGTQNNTASFPDQMSLFLGGEVTPKIGAFTQLTYAAADGTIGIDNVDIRFADRATIGNTSLLYGVTLHNNPTVQDVWNTTPAWSYPFVSSDFAPGPAAATIVDGTLGQQVLGLGAYGMWNGTLYTEFTAYRSAPQGVDAPYGADAGSINKGLMPYWRVALQKTMGRNYLEIGTYGMYARLYPGGVSGLTDKYTDVAFDAQFEHHTDVGSIVARSTFIHEKQTLDALVDPAVAGAANLNNSLNVFRINASWYPSQGRNSFTAGYFVTTGTADSLLYAPDPVDGSASGKPNSNGAILEYDFNPWLNTRLGAQYVLYSKFNGGSNGYDGSGRSASDNNTLYLYMWLAF